MCVLRERREGCYDLGAQRDRGEGPSDNGAEMGNGGLECFSDGLSN